MPYLAVQRWNIVCVSVLWFRPLWHVSFLGSCCSLSPRFTRTNDTENVFIWFIRPRSRCLESFTRAIYLFPFWNVRSIAWWMCVSTCRSAAGQVSVLSGFRLSLQEWRAGAAQQRHRAQTTVDFIYSLFVFLCTSLCCGHVSVKSNSSQT